VDPSYYQPYNLIYNKYAKDILCDVTKDAQKPLDTDGPKAFVAIPRPIRLNYKFSYG
jgi:hypothetical protein